MIHELRIHGLGVIEDAVVPFAAGLTVLTGETGAGKTMVLTGLGLLMGQKADSGVVRAGTGRADIDGEWLLDASDSSMLETLDEVGARVEIEGGQAVLVLGRTVAAEGRSRAFAGGRTVPSSALADITDSLVAVHGQSDQLLLREPRRQRELLDRFAGPDHATLLGDFRTAFLEWREVERLRRELSGSRQDRAREAELLRLGIAEIAAVAPEEGEDERLKVQSSVLAHATELVLDISAAHDLIAGGDQATDTASVVDGLSQARRLVERASTMDPDLAPLVTRIDDVMSGVADVAADLSDRARAIEADPALQARVEDRRQLLSTVKRKYGPGLSDVLEWWRRAEASVLEVDGSDARLEKLDAAAADLSARVANLSAAVSAGRRSAALLLALRVSGELRALAMPDAEIRIDVTSESDLDQCTSDGADDVAMMLRPHAGGDFRPLGKGASGGELSRIMLAIEVTLAGVETMPTFVFDEVDAGIGGKVAVEVGRRLASLARTAQVIVVTHLPQVAAFADRHVVVAKGSDGRITSASVRPVEGDERVQELVRMLSGLEGSASGAEHATELLELASRERS
jgi:DNA repair protein RecN (Recombination protein N)